MVITIFGATGDLAKRKLIPALYELFIHQYIPLDVIIIGVARRGLNDEEYRNLIKPLLPHIKTKDSNRTTFLKRLHFESTDVREPLQFSQLKERIEQLRIVQKMQPHYLFYLATSPVLYGMIADHIASAGLAHPVGGWTRLIIEKPFGQDLSSAQSLNFQLHKHFDDRQIFRIDHYLGKETVQNLLVFRFGNGIFEPLWNRQFIDHIEITAVEDMGIVGRGGYYDQAGAVRDMVQSHLLQLLCLVAMEPPSILDAQSLHDEMIRVLHTIHPMRESDVSKQVVRGQYLAGIGYKNKTIGNYREEPDVMPDSRTETYIAMHLELDSWRWSGVPFYIRTGKAMPTKVSEIVITFKPSPVCVFKDCPDIQTQSQKITLRLQPDEGIQLRFSLKKPSEKINDFQLEPVTMDFQYAQHDKYFMDAYSRLLLDCIDDDQTLFIRSDVLEATWQFVTPLLLQFRDDAKLPLYGYPAGTWGPAEADKLLADNQHWSNPCKNLTNTDRYCLL